jgi:hypothetical protein
MAWSVVFQRERLEAGVLLIMEMSMIPEYMPSITSAPDKARDLITAATRHTCILFASSCAESSISSFLIK